MLLRTGKNWKNPIPLANVKSKPMKEKDKSPQPSAYYLSYKCTYCSKEGNDP